MGDNLDPLFDVLRQSDAPNDVKIAALVVDFSDPAFVAAFVQLEEKILAALYAKQDSVQINLPVRFWAAMLDEIKDRRPKNVSYLLADDRIQKMDGLIDRLHEEISFLMVYGPSKGIAERFAGDRKVHGREIPTSASLKRSVRSWTDEKNKGS